METLIHRSMVLGYKRVATRVDDEDLWWIVELVRVRARSKRWLVRCSREGRHWCERRYRSRAHAEAVVATLTHRLSCGHEPQQGECDE